LRSVQYRAEVFDVRDLDEAKSIILTPEEGATTDERWEKETPYLVGEIRRRLAPTADSVILDYGCGIGRIARELIRDSGCTVIGVDISFRMRCFAQAYVQSENFVVCSISGLDRLIQRGLRVDHAYAVWVIQHCADPSEDITRLAHATQVGGLLYVANTHHRCLPTNVGWVDDGQDVTALISSRYDPLGTTPFPEGVVTDELRRIAASSLWRRK
jgi:SAM-dependent methyltransferase